TTIGQLCLQCFSGLLLHLLLLLFPSHRVQAAVDGVTHGAVATDHPICSEIGVYILQKQNGNAADAAVASALCLGVVNPTSSSLGGGAFILDARTTTHTSNGKVTEFIDCRETAPQNSSYDMFETLPPEASLLGGLAIAIPGELRGLELLHYRHGSLPWEEIVRPAMELARDGFIVASHLATGIQEKEEYIRSLPNLAYMLSKENDGVTLLKEGDLMIQQQLGMTLAAVMHGGADALYKGDRSATLAKDIQDAGGVITQSDIANYRPVLRDPLISRNIKGYTVVGAPPPSSGGGVIIGALRFLSGYATPFASLADTLSKHRYVEACRHAFAIRMSLSDPKFAREENADAINDLISGDYIGSLRNVTMDDDVLRLSQYGGMKWAQLKDTEGKDHGTTSLSVVDKDRNTVVITSSINLEFGSKVYSPSTGLILNNQMDDFATPGRADYFGLHPSESNYISPGKRALSSMSPTMVFCDGSNGDMGDLVLSLGGSGGPKIITACLQTILNFAFIGMPLYDAVSSARIHNQLLYHGAAGSNIEKRTRISLEKRGHKLIPSDFLGAVQAVSVDVETDTLTAVSDVRKQGMPAGY
ncbi:gamma-glutamyltransferase, partial [Thalassiosira pseudonana CCMP1335]